MKTKSEIAVEKFNEGFNCAQAVLYAFCEDLGIDRETALKMSCGFGGGMGRKEEVCGAVTGGIIAIGLKYGKKSKEEQEATETTYRKTRELMDEFKRRHGTYRCRELLGGMELTEEEGQRQFREKGMKNKVCIPCVESVAEITERILG